MPVVFAGWHLSGCINIFFIITAIATKRVIINKTYARLRSVLIKPINIGVVCQLPKNEVLTEISKYRVSLHQRADPVCRWRKADFYFSIWHKLSYLLQLLKTLSMNYLQKARKSSGN